jgi:hypothetical protein
MGSSFEKGSLSSLKAAFRAAFLVCKAVTILRFSLRQSSDKINPFSGISGIEFA